ncbi:hypothetical protein BKA70DRAFT_1124211 [Coprinopsis sp. MPI-PUGE-AT-0042]|nr:hypothetical protein BKA70DRAFT_1124211 [Coprinopsis sp. MPI-PUGE-AT-0042]
MTAKGLTEADNRIIQIKVAYLVSVWLEGFLYGVYLCLFIPALPILIRSKALKNPSSSIFFMGNVLIFILVSIHNGLGLFQVVVAFAYQASAEGTTQAYNQDYYVPILFATFVFTIGDALMIYRCFLVWQRNYWIIAPSVLLSVTSTGLHITVVWFATQVPRTQFVVPRWPPIALAIIFYFIQTSLTTFLIIWKIRSQCRRRTDTGLASVHVPCILSIMRIIAESAGIYTTGMLVLCTLLLVNNPGRAVIHACMLPITGIVFVLMALRIDAVRQESRRMPASASLLPTWLVDEPKPSESGAEPTEEDQQPTRTHTPPREISSGVPQPMSQASEVGK